SGELRHHVPRVEGRGRGPRTPGCDAHRPRRSPMAEVTLERSGGVGRVTLTRPPLNILTPSLIAEVGAAFRELAGDPDLRVVVLGAGGRAFSAGVEVQAMRDLDPSRARTFIERLHDTIRAARDCP